MLSILAHGSRRMALHFGATAMTGKRLTARVNSKLIKSYNKFRFNFNLEYMYTAQVVIAVSTTGGVIHVQAF
jgi:hypothetical protein